jgi:hypothetical protein
MKRERDDEWPDVEEVGGSAFDPPLHDRRAGSCHGG